MLKALAIIIVVAYHFGFMPMGYLGVDVFLVINGYLISNSLLKINTIHDGIHFMYKRFIRLWPITILSTIICLVFGSVFLLPFTFRTWLQNIIATNFFINNILLYLTTSDYWNVANDFNPLMHTWYLGVLVQFYLLTSLILVLIKKVFPRSKNVIFWTFLFFGGVSLMLFLSPVASPSFKFFNVPFRFFEVSIGVIFGLVFKNREFQFFVKHGTLFFMLAIISLFVLLINGHMYLNSLNVVLTNFLTAILLITSPYLKGKFKSVFSNVVFATIGKMSLSIYIWHQILLAFYRNLFPYSLNIWITFLLILCTLIFSIFSYLFIENWITKKINVKKLTHIGFFKYAIIVVLPVIGISMLFYSWYGILRDVPELGVYKNNRQPRAHIAYNENVFRYNKDFSDLNKLNWYVIGDSFGRDWINVLREMNIESEIELSYSTGFEIDRALKSDLIFCTMGTNPNALERRIEECLATMEKHNINTNKLCFVGSKRFGNCNHEYVKRYSGDYPNPEAFAVIENDHLIVNNVLKRKYGEQFIDLFAPVVVGENRIRVYTKDVKFISHDCVHLTSYGALFYADEFKNKIRELIIQSKECKSEVK